MTGFEMTGSEIAGAVAAGPEMTDFEIAGAKGFSEFS
jgi:hypothetical protein